MKSITITINDLIYLEAILTILLYFPPVGDVDEFYRWYCCEYHTKCSSLIETEHQYCVSLSNCSRVCIFIVIYI